MAYADKSCDMRRCCLAKGGHVQWEGVEIDGCRFLFRNRTCLDEPGATSYLTKEKVDKILHYHNNNLLKEEEPMMLLYQDDDYYNWDVKKDYVKKLDALVLTDEIEVKNG